MKFNYRPPYSMSGEPGKGLDVTRMPLDALGIDARDLQYRSMGSDRLSWVHRSAAVPDYLQEISIWDADNKCVLRGNVTVVDPVLLDDGTIIYECVAEGPWWWLEQAQLTAILSDDLNNESERAEFVTPLQDLSLSIAALITRMQALGVPLQIGKIDPTFTVPQMTFQSMSAAAALTTMLGWIPDAMTSIRYADSATPLLDVTRRPTAEINTQYMGSDSNAAGLPRLRARRSLLPSQVSVQSMQIDEGGNILFTEDSAGDGSAKTALGRQIVALAGNGKAGYRNNSVGIIKIKTMPIDTNANMQAMFYKINQGFASLPNQYYDIQTGNLTWTVTFNGGFQQFTVAPQEYYWIDDTATTLATLYTNVVVAGELPDWFAETGIKHQRIKIKRSFFAVVAKGSIHVAPASQVADSTTDLGDGNLLYIALPELELWALDTAYPTETVIVRPRDKALVTPISNLAKNLYDAQNFIPYDGDIPWHPAGQIPLPGEVISIRGGPAEWATMRAMITGCNINLSNGSAVLDIGRGGRSSAASLLDQFSRSASGRIINI